MLQGSSVQRQECRSNLRPSVCVYTPCMRRSRAALTMAYVRSAFQPKVCLAALFNVSFIVRRAKLHLSVAPNFTCPSPQTSPWRWPRARGAGPRPPSARPSCTCHGCGARGLGGLPNRKGIGRGDANLSQPGRAPCVGGVWWCGQWGALTGRARGRRARRPCLRRRSAPPAPPSSCPSPVRARVRARVRMSR